MRYVLLLLWLLFFPWGVYAQEVSLGISPMRHEVIAKPGTTLELPYTFTNYGDATQVTIEILRLQVADSVGNYTLLPQTVSDLSEPQFTLPNVTIEPFLILSKEVITGSIVVTIPEDTKEQDYYYAIVAKSQDTRGFETSSTVKLQAAITAPIYISVSSSGITNATLSKPIILLESSQHIQSVPFFRNGNAVSGTAAVENKGNNMATVTGRVHVKSSYSLWPYAGYTTNLQQTIVLAKSRNVIPLPDFPHMPPGRYNVTIQIESGATQQTSTISFIVFPIQWIGFSLLVGLIGVGVFMFKYRYTNT